MFQFLVLIDTNIWTIGLTLLTFKNVKAIGFTQLSFKNVWAIGFTHLSLSFKNILAISLTQLSFQKLHLIILMFEQFVLLSRAIKSESEVSEVSGSTFGSVNGAGTAEDLQTDVLHHRHL